MEFLSIYTLEKRDRNVAGDVDEVGVDCMQLRYQQCVHYGGHVTASHLQQVGNTLVHVAVEHDRTFKQVLVGTVLGDHPAAATTMNMVRQGACRASPLPSYARALAPLPFSFTFSIYSLLRALRLFS
jgi:hypothetical protein